MPQMAPLLWLVLFFYFVVIFILYVVSLYFIALPLPASSIGPIESNNSGLTWLW